MKLEKGPWQLPQHEPEVYTAARTLTGLAYHEAGHSIIARLAKIPFSTIVIQRGGTEHIGFVGSVDVDGGLKEVRRDGPALHEPLDLPDGDYWIHKALAMRHVCFHLAGLQAELLLHGIASSPPLTRHDTDHKQAAAKLYRAFGTRQLTYPQTITRAYLSRCWGEVKRTATELLARHELHGIGVIKRNDPADISFFSHEVPGGKWTDEQW